MKSGAFAGDERGNPHLGVSCARLAGENLFYVSISIGGEFIQGVITRFQLDKLIEVLYAESGGDKEE